MLPRQYEAHRAEIEAILPPIHLPVPASAATLITSATGPEDVSGDALGFIHRYVPPAAGAELASSTTLLLLHGTGGDEEDLIPLGRGLLPGAGLLSPRGKVRSEEHTSELQSHSDLVCRLLLEKKKKRQKNNKWRTSTFN